MTFPMMATLVILNPSFLSSHPGGAVLELVTIPLSIVSVRPNLSLFVGFLWGLFLFPGKFDRRVRALQFH
jgi:thiamine transporter ThiT